MTGIYSLADHHLTNADMLKKTKIQARENNVYAEIMNDWLNYKELYVREKTKCINNHQSL